MKMQNPFPGMNPFFEQTWRDAHTRLITYLHDSLQEHLPPDLIARAEEEAIAIGAGGPALSYPPDVQVREPWSLKEPAGVETTHAASLRPPSMEPVRVLLDEDIERWIEILDKAGRLVTVLELLSPSNKLGALDRERYFRKRGAFLSGGVNFVEIDLLRQGVSVFVPAVQRVLQAKNACYGVCVFRAARPRESDVYPIPLRERLPAICIPLRLTDSDLSLDLQPLVDLCHERGRYHLLDYGRPLTPPLSPADADWAKELLHQQQSV